MTMTRLRFASVFPLFVLESFCAALLTLFGLGFAFSSLTWAFLATAVRDGMRIVTLSLLQRLAVVT